MILFVCCINKRLRQFRRLILTGMLLKQRQKFEVGEPVILKDIEFEITEIGTNRLILKPIKKWN